ncbi:PREDICTED: transcription termination factor MTERF5, chloroplastic-like [Tarenaya hassleriana]|uniref:transcription termination factor MTERF5, chloroplastic-like n=1 Tax=Tarenaya hassleriana TaxID=28532 RepID=UPI00053C1D99|nr:PREDICTED: transcription termination factor MTERF5, chloroplastic-like [Tarenaya hassleriana]XP_010553395.1 PREDICTED: transcription termination factor MTERF5, chloroplastic-like [Tarenaya hassleriana]XP_010553396.1 PREDICTED: transcription termination factor MTERF5, chloroplastic-like [Tarenaya hassleriana]
MAAFSYLKRDLGYSPYLRNAGNFVDDLGIAFRFSGLAFSSVGDVETRNGQKQDGLKLDPVSGLLQRYGFTSKQMAKVSKSVPLVYSFSVETLTPKLRFLRSILGSENDVCRVVTANPRVLTSSLKNQLEPNYEFIKSIIEQDDLIAKSIKRSSRILHLELEGNLAAKVSFLRGNGVTNSSIAKLMVDSPGILALPSSRLEELLEKAKSFGFESSRPMIVPAVRAISQITESNWDQKLEVYKRWGWSNDDFLTAFKRQPNIMTLSEEKISKGMDVLLNRVGLSSLDIVKYPNILFFNLEERIIPRCSVVDLLHSKGVLGESRPSISTYIGALRVKEEAFVKRFVDRYPEHVLELWQKFRLKALV